MILYKGGYKYQLAQDYSMNLKYMPSETIVTDYIELDMVGVLKIKKGYAWDGVTLWPDRDNMMRASLVHDALYQLITEGHLNDLHKPMADEAFKKVLIEDGVWKWLASLYYKAVTRFGQPSSNPKKLLKSPKS